jgi:GxxExxY protein
MTENQISREVVDGAFKVHSHLGPGLLESVYEKVMKYELEKRGLFVVRHVQVPIIYDGIELDRSLVSDLFVEDKVIVELKSVEELAPVHKKQLLTYLRLANKRLGLLINFNVNLIKDGEDAKEGRRRQVSCIPLRLCAFA